MPEIIAVKLLVKSEVLKYQIIKVELLKITPVHFILILSFIVISCFPAFAQSSSHPSSSSLSITVMTDKSSYSDGDKIIISGIIKDQLNVPISLAIKDPSENVVLIGQITPDSDNTYSAQVTAGGRLWTAAGTYEIDVTYGSKDVTAKTTFEFTGYHAYPIEIQGIDYDATYVITNGNIVSIKPNTDSKSLAVTIDSKGNGTIAITFPRALIDAKTNNQDSQFVVQEDGIVITPEESKSDTSRTLTISFSSNTKQIEIIGTQIVPEFGPLALVILTVSVILLLFYTKRQSFIAP